ncbi:hypothetical protein D3C73_996450 [compost metagenome]
MKRKMPLLSVNAACVVPLMLTFTPGSVSPVLASLTVPVKVELMSGVVCAIVFFVNAHNMNKIKKPKILLSFLPVCAGNSFLKFGVGNFEVSMPPARTS